MGRKGDFGFEDGPSSGGYESIQCNDAQAQSTAKSMECVNEKAASVTTPDAPNLAGGAYSGVDKDVK